MLKSVRLTNFKCFEDVSIKFGQITVFIGPNGTGKSSVAQALILLKQSLNQFALQLSNPYISLGSFDDVLNNKAKKERITIAINGTYPLGRGLKLLRVRVGGIDFSYEAEFGRNSLITHHTTLSARRLPIGPPELTLNGVWSREYESKVEPSKFEVEGAGVDFSVSNSIGIPIRVSGGHSGNKEGDKEKYLELSEFFESFTSTIKNVLENVYLVPGIRGVEKPTAELLDSPVNEFISSEGPSKQTSNLSSTLGYKPEVGDKISSWTDRLAGVKIRQKLAIGKKTGIEAIRPNLKTNIVNEGLGLNQIIFPFSQLAISPPNSLIAIEEPELHLHPKAQSELVDIFIEISKTEDKQILLITHSEHILFRLLTKVAKGELKPQDLVVNYFEKEDAGAKVKELEVDENGSLKGGLPGFFEEEIKGFKEYLDALTSKGKT